jgi:hypothetical protein
MATSETPTLTTETTGTEPTLESLAAEPWFPAGAARSLVPAEASLTAFNAFTLHIEWDSLSLALPLHDPFEVDWWNDLLATSVVRTGDVNAGLTSSQKDEPSVWWGSLPIGDLSAVSSFSSHSGMGFRLTDSEGEVTLCQLLPLDAAGHGRRMAELELQGVLTACGGLQWEGRDLLLFWDAEVEQDEILSELVEKLLIAGDAEGALGLVTQAGRALGRLHTQQLALRSLPNDERRWNERLKWLETTTRSETLWRVPHSKDTRATLTHQNFGLEVVHLRAGEALLACHSGGVYNALAPADCDFPVHRDLAAGYRSIASLCARVGAGGIEADLRLALFEGWKETVPAQTTSSQALDSHRGGVLIWEYEQALEQRLLHQAFAKDEPREVTDWLERVSGIQSSMFRARTLSALSLVCWAIALWGLVAWVRGGFEVGLTILPFILAAIFAELLRRMYRALAPAPH